MIGQSNSDINFGIQGYNIPTHYFQLPSSPRFSFPKESEKRYLKQIMKRSEDIPEPGRHNRKMLWKGKLGVMKGNK